MKTLKDKFRVPEYMDVPWLTLNYVFNHGFVVDIPRTLGDTQGNPMGYKKTKLGSMPILSRTEIRASDIVIFDDYFEFEDERGYATDRFGRIDEYDINLFLNKKSDLLPVGVIVHQPISE